MSVRDVVQAAAGVGGGGGGEYVEDVFSTYLYTGTGSAQTINNGIDLSDGAFDGGQGGGLVWLKSRSTTGNNLLVDTARGPARIINSNTTNAQVFNPAIIPQFNTTGFDTGNGDGASSGTTYASWTFRKAPKFFDVVTWTGDGQDNRQIAHNLGSVPGCIMVKKTNTTGQWFVYHRGLNNGVNAAQYYLNLETTNAQGQYEIWENTTPTSTVFTINSFSGVNGNSDTYVAYVFAHDAGGFGDDGEQNVISCGSFTTDASLGAASVSLGWEPQFVIIKKSSGTGDWALLDSMRGWVNGSSDKWLRANASDAEATNDFGYPTATGFEAANLSGSATYIYIAIRRPMKTPELVTEVYDAKLISGTMPADVEVDTPFAPDLLIQGQTNAVNNKFWASRLTKAYYFSTNGAGVDYWKFDGDGGQVYFPGAQGGSPILYFFKRAPKFLDLITYKGNQSVRTVPHNLGVAPEIMLIFNKSSIYFNIWAGDANLNGLTLYGGTGNIVTNNNFLNNTAPTATEITLGNSTEINTTGTDYEVALFATLAGISKVGTFSHTSGTPTNVDCGFANGAKLVIWRQYDGAGGTTNLFDAIRGIAVGNEPYFQMYTVAAQIVDDLIAPLSSGFTVSNDSVNATGNYIFLAIA